MERDRLDGTCTNDACVPTRALAKAARLIRVQLFRVDLLERFGQLSLGGKEALQHPGL